MLTEILQPDRRLGVGFGQAGEEGIKVFVVGYPLGAELLAALDAAALAVGAGELLGLGAGAAVDGGSFRWYGGRVLFTN